MSGSFQRTNESSLERRAVSLAGLGPAWRELISNAYDADAALVQICADRSFGGMAQLRILRMLPSKPPSGRPQKAVKRANGRLADTPAVDAHFLGLNLEPDWHQDWSHGIAAGVATSIGPLRLASGATHSVHRRKQVQMKESDPGPEYHMTLSLNVLNHLGLNLYSSNPAVLSEAVANAWDADATRVDITLDLDAGRIILQDDGIGMTDDDINERFLRVGYKRRDAESPLTERGRPVMGRKGIGKLAMFGIADEILVETAKGGKKSALSMNLNDINAAITSTDPSLSQTYRPQPQSTDGIDFEHGTRITLTELKKDINRTAPHLRKRLARRFSILGADRGFQIFIGGEEVTASDQELLQYAQYAWTYPSGIAGKGARGKAKDEARIFERSFTTSDDNVIDGWIATAVTPAQLKGGSANERYNRISVFVRGKLAQEDILDEFDEVSLYRNYIFGEIHADFLDSDAEPDIATSSRQKLKEDDPRYEDLREWVQSELDHIRSKWTELRNEGGTKDATKNPDIEAWFKDLGKDNKRRAERLFGKINQLGLDDHDRMSLYGYGILAFETMSQKDNLDALEDVSASDLQTLSKILGDTADLEAAMYHKIVRSRLAVIEKMDNLVGQDELERVLQEYLFDHLWLLDPSWERATIAEMEQKIGKRFAEIIEKIPEEERNSRFDIKYQRTSGLHVIVELKRASVRTSSFELLAQIEKYRNALRNYLASVGKEMEPVAVVCVVGKPLVDWENPNGRVESANVLAAKETRVVQYDQLLFDAKNAYNEYLVEGKKIGRIQAILDSLAAASTDESIPNP